MLSSTYRKITVVWDLFYDLILSCGSFRCGNPLLLTTKKTFLQSCVSKTWHFSLLWVSKDKRHLLYLFSLSHQTIPGKLTKICFHQFYVTSFKNLYIVKKTSKGIHRFNFIYIKKIAHFFLKNFGLKWYVKMCKQND